MNIVLIGLRGSGKTSIGKLLAEKLHSNFIDLDKEIEKAENKKIADMVEENDWEYFREKEKEMVLKVSELNKNVIATGGGAVLDPQNVEALKKHGIFIYLHRKPKICATHIMDDPNRPPLTNEKSASAQRKREQGEKSGSASFEPKRAHRIKKELKLLYKERDPLYKKTADITFYRSNNLKEDTETLFNILYEQYPRLALLV